MCTIVFLFPYRSTSYANTLSINDNEVDSFSISWSSPAQSVCQAISHNITLFIALDDGIYENLAT